MKKRARMYWNPELEARKNLVELIEITQRRLRKKDLTEAQLKEAEAILDWATKRLNERLSEGKGQANENSKAV